VTPLRQRMLEDMQIRHLASSIQHLHRASCVFRRQVRHARRGTASNGDSGNVVRIEDRLVVLARALVRCFGQTKNQTLNPLHADLT